MPGSGAATGNAAGTGPLIAVLSGAARREIEEVVRGVEKIETAVEPRFQEHFVAALAFPHRTATFDNLRRVVDLPARAAGGGGGPPTTPAPRRRRGAGAPPPAGRRGRGRPPP